MNFYQNMSAEQSKFDNNIVIYQIKIAILWNTIQIFLTVFY